MKLFICALSVLFLSAGHVFAADEILDEKVTELEIDSEVEDFAKEEHIEDIQFSKAEQAKLKSEENKLRGKIDSVSAQNNSVRAQAAAEQTKLVQLRAETRKATGARYEIGSLHLAAL